MEKFTNREFMDALDAITLRIYMLYYYVFSNYCGLVTDVNDIQKINSNTTHKLSFVLLLNEHYTCFYVSNRKIYYYDSNGNKPSKDVLKKTIKLLKNIEPKRYTLICNPTKYQSNVSGNCGWFVLNYLFGMYDYGKFLKFNESNIAKFKLHLLTNRFFTSLINLFCGTALSTAFTLFLVTIIYPIMYVYSYLCVFYIIISGYAFILYTMAYIYRYIYVCDICNSNKNSLLYILIYKILCTPNF